MKSEEEKIDVESGGQEENKTASQIVSSIFKNVLYIILWSMSAVAVIVMLGAAATCIAEHSHMTIPISISIVVLVISAVLSCRSYMRVVHDSAASKKKFEKEFEEVNEDVVRLETLSGRLQRDVTDSTQKAHACRRDLVDSQQDVQQLETENEQLKTENKRLEQEKYNLSQRYVEHNVRERANTAERELAEEKKMRTFYEDLYKRLREELRETIIWYFMLATKAWDTQDMDFDDHYVRNAWIRKLRREVIDRALELMTTYRANQDKKIGWKHGHLFPSNLLLENTRPEVIEDVVDELLEGGLAVDFRNRPWGLCVIDFTKRKPAKKDVKASVPITETDSEPPESGDNTPV